MVLHAKAETMKGGLSKSSARLLDLDSSVGIFVDRHVSIVVTSAALETLHLPGLQLGEILLARVDTCDLVSHNVRLDVLLCSGL